MAYNPLAPVAAPPRPKSPFDLMKLLKSGAYGQQGVMGANQRLLDEAGRQGLFDPRGNQLIRRQVRAHALRTARNRVGRGGVLSRLSGLDPQQARVAQLGFEQGAGEDISNALGEADIQQASSAQDFLRSLYGGQLDFERQQLLQKQAERAAKKAAGNPLTQLAGAAVGAVLPGYTHLLPGYKK